MGEHSIRDLNYGHFGQAVYNTTSKEWLFSRQRNRCGLLKPLGNFTLAIAPAITAVIQTPEPTDRPSRASYNRSQRLLKNHPVLQPAAELLQPSARLSEAINDAVGSYDPAQGDLWSFGKAAAIGPSRSTRPVSIIALPAGECKDVLRILHVRKERQGWESDKSIWIEVPRLGRGESGYWVGNGAPIQQLCFAQSLEECSTFLAVRLRSSTLVFRPLLRHVPVPPVGVHLGCEYPPSRVDANLILELPMHSTGGVSHADVTFNPWYQRQFAVVDQRGKWNVFEIEGQKRKRYTYAARSYRSGDLVDHTGLEGKGTDLYHDDGWARVLWVNNANMIVLCNRTRIALFDIREEPVPLKWPDLGLARTSDWILDVKRSPAHPDQLFVLTSSQLVWVRTIYHDVHDSDPAGAEGAVVLFSWRHFRDSEDIAMQMSITCAGEGASEGAPEITTALLYSRFNTLVTSFRVFLPDESPSLPVSLTDPSSIQIPLGNINRGAAPPALLGVYLEPLHYKENLQNRRSGPGESYLRDGLRFYAFKLLYYDLSAAECLFYVYHGYKEDIILAPKWKRLKAAQSDPSILEDNFLVADWVQDDDALEVLPTPEIVRYTRRRPGSGVHGEQETQGDARTVDNARVYGKANRVEARRPAPEQDEVAEEADGDDISSITGKTKLFLETDTREHHVGTIFDIFGSPPRVVDVDRASEIFQSLLHYTTTGDTDDTRSSVIEPLAPASRLGLSSSDNDTVSISTTFDSLIASWLTPMPLNISGRIRLAKERLARKIAVELCLASVAIKTREPITQVEPTFDTVNAEAEEHGAGIYTLPLRSSSKGKERGRQTSVPFPDPASSFDLYSASQPYPSSGLPIPALPTPSATPSLVSGTSFSSSISGSGNAHVERLRQYVNFNKPPTSFPRHIGRVEAHWTIGSDPNTYDYNATRQALNATSDTENEGMSALDRERLRKKAERFLRKQRQSAATASHPITQPALQHMPLHRSSPVAPLPPFQDSSQAGPSQPFAATQIMRGTYGGRPPPAKKRRRGPEGFR